MRGHPFIPCVTRRLLLPVAMLLAGVASSAQVLPFEILGLKEGLPQSQVACIAQDRDGYLWVGTWGGLARYNGDGFKSFYAKDGLPSNRIEDLLAAKDGTLWIASAGGVGLWKDHQLQSHPSPLVSGVRCRALAEDPEHRIWVGTDRGIALVEKGTARRIGAEGARVYDLFSDPSGMYAVTDGGLLLAAADGKLHPLPGPTLPPGVLRRVLRTAEGLWLGTQGHGLFRLEGSEWKPVPAEQMRGREITRLCSDRAGRLYVCTSDAGLFLRSPGDRTFERWGAENGLLSNSVNEVFQDREDNLWIATDIGGLARLGSFAVQNHGTTAGFPSPCVFGINPGPNPDTLWLGTLRGAVLYQFRPQAKVLEVIDGTKGLSNDWVWEALELPGGELWILTDSSLYVRRSGSKVLEPAPPEAAFTQGGPQDLLRDDAGRLWLSGENPALGGLCVRGTDGRWRRWDKASDGSAFTQGRRLALRRAGGVWVTAGDRVYQCDGETLTPLQQKPPLPGGGNISALYEDRVGRVWAGQDTGLARRGQDGQWEVLNDTPGFDDTHVFLIGAERSGTVWVGTARGVYRFLPDDRVQALMPQDGLAGFETNQGAFFCDEEGGVWTGTVTGLSRYDSRRYEPNLIPPEVVVEAAVLSNKAVPYPTTLDLPWSQRSVTFRIATLAFRGHPRCAYRARMEGLEKEWLPLSLDPNLRYTNLPQGKHILTLQAVNESGVWGQTVSLPIRVRPPFWLTWWFQAMALVLIVGAAVGGHRWRTHLLKQRNEDLERTVAERTLALEKANEDLTHLATYEPLTGLFNRRAILERLEAQSGRRCGCILVDLDHFKAVNDRLGHAEGDRVLRQMAASIKGTLRDGDTMGRYGGDEFLLVLPGADLSALESVAKRICEMTLTVGTSGDAVTVSTSCGVVSVPGGPPMDQAALLATADALLYEVKAAGRKGYRAKPLPA
jgi:diguanylate cyclase (GGDEF)-like protein